VTRRGELAIVTGITLLGAALRLYQIGAQSLWLDELFSVAVARGNWMIATNPPARQNVSHGV